ncbi:hybrid sensor histidine kinase/response regulator [Chitinibacter tainanensis]|uniref:ATP-binding response regulator n=1 Tax=Chitinibacter tainanensis TaxID=230667 RepID=UPI0023545C2D|nr:hybrid sensor histidine kinase/response regulator [Chitinibacter tainanensis]
MFEHDDWLQDDDEASANAPHAAPPWKIAIIDDEPDIHLMTQLSLKKASYRERPLQLISAFSAREGFELLHAQPDIAMILLDVVMETEDAGLRLVERIRQELGNQRVRIVLRTGQPGQAPERAVISRYDINDYKCKTELSADRLYSSVISSLRSYELLSELEAQSAQLASIIQLSANAVAYFGPDGLLAYANQGLSELLLQPLEQLLGQPLASTSAALQAQEVCHVHTFRPLALEQLPALLAAEPSGLNLLLRRPSLRYIHLKGQHTPDGGLVLYLRDITRETELERMKSEFLSHAAHELRTPIVSIRGFTELMLHRQLSAEQSRDMLETIHRQSLRLSDLVSDLLDLAKLEADGATSLQLSQCSLPQCLEGAVQSILGSERGRLSLQLASDLAPLEADAAKLQQALRQILSNALLYSAPDSPIVITAVAQARHAQTGLQLEIRDQGIGMSPEQLNHAFERFYRADTSGHLPGTGLGLALVKEIIGLLGGEVWLTSQLGVGTSVFVWLPTAASHPASSTPNSIHTTV